MIEMKLKNNANSITSLYIENKNIVLVKNHKELYKFINMLTSKDSEVIFGSTKIDNKNSIIINLLDYSCIADQLSLKKGTFLYEYLINEIETNANIENVKEDVEKFIKEKIVNNLNCTIDYDFNFNIDISKIVNAFISFEIDLSIENYILILKKIIQFIHLSNSRKKIIILLNSDIFSSALDDLNDIYLFKFYDNLKPNIIIGEDVTNIDVDLLKSYIINNAPLSIDKYLVRNIIDKYMDQLRLNSNLICENLEERVCFEMLNKVLKLECKIYCIEKIENMPDIYQNFINSL